MPDLPLISSLLPASGGRVGVAVSGGADSMALLYALAHKGCFEIDALTFDHGLRPESAVEAAQVGAWVAGWPGVRHHILRWDGDKPNAAIMEAARAARYAALCGWCDARGIASLCVAHHAGDQAETILFRLAKGSGLDGLGGMATRTAWPGYAVDIIRPFLDTGRDDIVSFCHDFGVPYVNDPSNVNEDYARPRLRKVMPLLAAEGLSEKRLSRTALRLRRAREALDFYTAHLIAQSVRFEEPERARIDCAALRAAPEEIRLRLIRQVAARLAPGGDGYGLRLDRLEEGVSDLLADPPRVPRFTLGGLVFGLEGRGAWLDIVREGL